LRGGPPEWAGRVATTRHRWDCRGRCAPLALVGCLVGIHTPTAPGWATGAVARWGASGTASHCRATVAFASCTQCPRSSPLDRSSCCAPREGCVGQRGLVYSTAGRATDQKAKQEARWPAADAVLPSAFVLASCRGAARVHCQLHCPPATFSPFPSCLKVVGRCPTPTGERGQQAKVNCRAFRRLLLGAALVSAWHRESTHTCSGSL